jgi:hypothetical protein
VFDSMHTRYDVLQCFVVVVIVVLTPFTFCTSPSLVLLLYSCVSFRLL